jgi:hypothetical protein
MPTSLEETLKKYIEAKKLLEDNELLVESGLVALDGNKEFREAELLLAKTTQVSADLLAETTQISADLLAKTTLESADELRISNKISVEWMQKLTVTLIVVGLIQIIVAVVTLLK